MCVPRRQARAAGDPQAVDRRRINVVVLHQGEFAGGLVLVQRQHCDGRGQDAVGLCAGLVARGVFKLHHRKHRLAFDALDVGVRQGEQRSAVRAVRKEMPRLRGHRTVHDGLVQDVVVAAGQHRAALAVRHPVARDEEGVVGKFVILRGAAAVGDLQARSHAGGGHGGRVGQRGRGHRCKACRCVGAAGARRGGAARQHGAGGQRSQRQHGGGCDEAQGVTA